MTTRIFTLVNIGLATLSLSIGYWLHSQGAGVGTALALGGLWLAGQYRPWPWLNNTIFSAFIILAAYGTWTGVATGWLLFTVITVLMAWDVSLFKQRLVQAPSIRDETAHHRRHLQRLFVVAGGGLLLGGLTLAVPLNLNLVGAIFLGLLIMVGLGRGVRLMRQGEEKRDPTTYNP